MALACPHCGSHHVQCRGATTAGSQRYCCMSCGKWTTQPVIDDAATTSQLDLRSLRKAKRFVVTSAQNNTPLHQPFWKSLLTYCDHNNAQLLVIPVRYRNPDAFHQNEDEAMEWPVEVLPYLLDKDYVVNDHLVFMGDLKINATAVSPLTGLDTIAGTRSAIIGHAQVEMKMIATPHQKLPKMLHTTGTVSLKNYSRSKAGKKAEWNHSLAAVVVEVKGEKFWVREISCDDNGGFYDLDNYYTHDRVSAGHRAEALVLGDEHVKFLSPEVKRATWGRNGIVNALRPKVLVRHDLHDHYSQSHHHESDTILKITKATNGHWSIKDELELTRDHLVETTPEDCESWIVESNHHDHLYKWLNRFDANRDPHNAVFAWKLKGKVAEAIEKGEDNDPFKVYIKTCLPADVLQRIRFVGSNDTALIGGIDVSQHGHVGPNGSRPSPMGFAKSAYRMFTAHSHTPHILHGLWTVGVSAPMMGYTKGLSSWMTTHGVIYPDGKRTLIHIIGDQWHGD